MKKLALLALLFACLFSCKKHKDVPGPKFIRFDGQFFSATLAKDGNIYVCGTFKDSNSIWKISPGGNVIWRNTYSFASYFYDIVEDQNGNIFASGVARVNSDLDATLIKLNANGDLQWYRTYDSDGDDLVSGIILTKDGNLLISGASKNKMLFGVNDLYLIKTNLSGDTQWALKPISGGNMMLGQLIELKLGGFSVSSSISNISVQMALFKLDNSVKWQWTQLNVAGTMGYSLVEMADGSLITCGSRDTGDGSQVWIQRSDASGQLIWSKEYGVPKIYEVARSIVQNADGSLVITGTVEDKAAKTKKILFMMIDAEGNSGFNYTISRTASDVGMKVLKDKNDDNLLFGNTGNQFYMVRSDSKGKFK